MAERPAANGALSKEVDLLRRENSHLRRHLALLSTTAARVASTLDVDAVLQAVVNAACELTSARFGALSLADSPAGEARFYTHGLREEERRAIGAPPIGLGVLGLVRQLGRPVRLADVTKHERFLGFPAGHPSLRSFLGVPVQEEGAAIASLYVAEKTGDAEFSPEDEELLSLFAQQAARAIRNARLFVAEQKARALAE